MRLADLASFLAEALEIKTGTVLDRAKALRAAGLLSLGKQGRHAGAHMSSRDAINLLLGCAIEHRRGEGVAAGVTALRDTRLMEDGLGQLPANFTAGLESFASSTAGEALENFLDDLRSGRLALWAADEVWDASATIDSRGRSASMYIGKPEKRSALDFRHAIQSFAPYGYDADRKQSVERQITVHAPVFKQLASLLGPIPEAPVK